MRMCTEDSAASTSAKMRGKNSTPSTQGSIVAAVDQAVNAGDIPAATAHAQNLTSTERTETIAALEWVGDVLNQHLRRS